MIKEEAFWKELSLSQVLLLKKILRPSPEGELSFLAPWVASWVTCILLIRGILDQSCWQKRQEAKKAPYDTVNLKREVNHDKLKMVTKDEFIRKEQGNCNAGHANYNKLPARPSRVCGRLCVWVRHIKSLSWSLIKSKTNGEQLWKFLEQTKPVQSRKESSVQLLLWEQPDLSHFLFMPLETISPSFQEISNVVSSL